MDILRTCDDLPASFSSAAVTLGNFDGVHLGHRELFRTLVRTAKQLNCPSIVYTFDPHPLKILAPEKAPLLLNTTAEKQRLIAASHVDYLIETPFTNDFATMSPEQFVSDVLVSQLKIKALIVGYDYAFGKGRCGNTDFLKACGEKYGFAVEVLQPVGDDGLPYSSTRIRKMISEGDVLLSPVISVAVSWVFLPLILKQRRSSYLLPASMLSKFVINFRNMVVLLILAVVRHLILKVQRLKFICSILPVNFTVRS